MKTVELLHISKTPVWISNVPVAQSVQLSFERRLVLLQHVPQRNRHMLPVFPLGTLQAHGRFTWLAVKLHHLQMVQWSATEKVLEGGASTQGISSSLWWICGGSFYLVSSYSPCPRGWGRRGAGTPWRRWPTPGRCSRPACCTPGLAAGLPWGWWWRNCSARPPHPSLARWRSVCTLGRTASETGEGCSSVDICARGTI